VLDDPLARGEAEARRVADNITFEGYLPRSRSRPA
jgi:hypothetical protein